MAQIDKFKEDISQGYTFVSDSILLGAAKLQDSVYSDLKITLPLKTLNRHGLITGATGTGKTKTVQRLCEMLSEKSIPVLVMDIKGDISGISQVGTSNPIIEERIKSIDYQWSPKSYPVEFLSITQENGIRMKATVSEFGPVLFAKILELNETQESVLSVIFKFADDNALPLVDLKDLKTLIQHVTNEGKQQFSSQYGAVSTSTTGIILRKIIEIENQGANLFFGEKSFDVEDLMRIDTQGYGYINILRLATIQDKPKLFSTFMLALLAEIYQKFPEEGDMDQPKLVMIIDEAHLIFNNASRTLLNQIETVIKLIRSKGVGIIFCTQSPNDIPQNILGQLGMKIQHALRAFSAQDRTAIQLISRNFPITEFYKTDEEITKLGIGEALVTVLNEKGEPTSLVHTVIASPQSRMDTITSQELDTVINLSALVGKYNTVIDPMSAYEILSAKLQQVSGQNVNSDGFTQINGVQNYSANQPKSSTPVINSRSSSKSDTNMFKSILKSASTSFVRNATGQITRSVLGSILKKMK
ncbi:MAG TPA: DUF853 family protein [Candidatus Dojkabacteria bacterium]|nr:DUF853 family protein [Candidatus Dojkabacteria bacterium]